MQDVAFQLFQPVRAILTAKQYRRDALLYQPDGAANQQLVQEPDAFLPTEGKAGRITGNSEGGGGSRSNAFSRRSSNISSEMRSKPATRCPAATAA
jgi:hypothetical protein